MLSNIENAKQVAGLVAIVMETEYGGQVQERRQLSVAKFAFRELTENYMREPRYLQNRVAVSPSKFLGVLEPDCKVTTSEYGEYDIKKKKHAVCGSLTCCNITH